MWNSLILQMISCWKTKPVTQLGWCPTFQALQYTGIYNTVLAERPGSQHTLHLHCSGGGIADEPAVLYLPNEKEGAQLHCLSRGMNIVYRNIRSSVFHHIHMVNLYTSLCPLACTVGPLWEFSSAVIITAVSSYPCTLHTPHCLHCFKFLLSP